MAVSTLKLRKATIDRTQLLKSSPILSYLSSAKAVPPNACKAEQGREVTNELPGGMVLERNCLPYRHDIQFCFLTLKVNRSQLLVRLGPRELRAPGFC